MEIMVAMCIDKEFSRGGARHKYYGIRVLDSVSKIGRILIICIRSKICSEKEIVIVEKKLLSFFLVLLHGLFLHRFGNVT